MIYKWNPFTRNFDLVATQDSSTGGQISNLSLVFYESFTGNGVDTTFTLNGSVGNATWSSGTWNLSKVMTTLPSHATKNNKKALYNSNNIFTKRRIQILSIDGSSGEITLSHPPINGEVFRIWYWYTLYQTDILSSYIREDFVASMEGNIGSGDSLSASNIILNTSNFNGALSSYDYTVQRAMDTLDDHSHGSNFYTEVNCNTTDSKGDFMYISGNINSSRYTMSKIDQNDSLKMPSCGVLVHKYSDVHGLVQWIGEVTLVYSGLSVGRKYFATSSGPSITPPSIGGNGYSMVQSIGIAVSSDVLLLTGEVNMIKRL